MNDSAITLGTSALFVTGVMTTLSASMVRDAKILDLADVRTLGRFKPELLKGASSVEARVGQLALQAGTAHTIAKAGLAATVLGGAALIGWTVFGDRS